MIPLARVWICRGSCQLPLQQIHLGAFRRGFGEANADADEADRFPRATEAFFEQWAKMFQRGRKARALGGCAREIVELQFHENFRDLAS